MLAPSEPVSTGFRNAIEERHSEKSAPQLSLLHFAKSLPMEVTEKKAPGRPHTVTKAECFKAADAIQRRGETPSIEKVRSELKGCGSTNHLVAYMREWREAHYSRMATQLPEKLAKELDAYRQQAFTEGQTLAQAQINAMQEDLDQLANELHSLRQAHELLQIQAEEFKRLNGMLSGQVAAQQNEVTRLLAEAARARTERDEAIRNASTSQRDCEQLADQASRLETALEQARRKLDSEQEARIHAEGELREARVRNEALQDKVSDLQQRVQELKEEQRPLRSPIDTKPAMAEPSGEN